MLQKKRVYNVTEMWEFLRAKYEQVLRRGGSADEESGLGPHYHWRADEESRLGTS